MKILIRGTNWIGDAVMTIPAMRELNRIFPDSHLTLWTRPWAEGIFRDVDFVDEIITFDKKPRRLGPTLAEAEMLEKEKFDLAVLFTNSFESALVTKLAKIPRRIGFNKDLRGLLLTDPIAVPEWKGRAHEVFYYLELVKETENRIFGTQSVGIEAPDIRLHISDERLSNARSKLEKAGIDLSQTTVAIGPGSTNSRAKRWPAERFSALADRLNADSNIVLIGAVDEQEVAAEVIKNSRSSLIDLTGKTDLAEAAAILAVADLFVANDMGLAHIASAVCTDTIVIFGPTDDATTRPYGENSTVIRHDVECSPCMLRDCPIDHRCMTGVSVDKVFETATLRLRPASTIISHE